MVPLEPEDQCMLMYSSGTTGLPKGVIINHGMMLWAQFNAGRADAVHDGHGQLCRHAAFPHRRPAGVYLSGSLCGRDRGGHAYV